jgi:hypothetical protein
LYFNLIHQTFKDKSIREITDEPDSHCLYRPLAKIVSKNRDGYSPEEQKMLDQIAGIISEMSNDGINMETCLFAARSLGIWG